jgi:hypothetical protein
MPTHIGASLWTRDAMRAGLEQFAALYERRPIRDNLGGMHSPHMFLFWFVMRELQPAVVIESGVWRGQGTWLIEQTCPDARIYSIDINWKNLVYRSEKVTYLSTDFVSYDWRALPKESTLIYFDDHMNALQRCLDAHRFGFRHLMFDDNYFPPYHGDFYTLKSLFAHTGYKAPQTVRAIIERVFGARSDKTVQPNAEDHQRLRRIVDIYEELPPVIKSASTRWGTPWEDIVYPTPPPLLTRVERPYQKIYLDEAWWYTWPCYVRLRNSR